MLPSRLNRRHSRLHRIYRYAYLRLVRKNDSAERVGRGAAVGIFIGVFPTLWFGPILAPAAAGVIGANRAAALGSMILTGPIMPFIWTLCVLVGNALVSPERRIARALLLERDAETVLKYFFTTFLLGNLLVSVAMAVAGYALFWWLAHRYRLRRGASRLEPAVQAEEQ